MYLDCCNEKHKEYNNLLYNLKLDIDGPIYFNKEGKLIICLIEFRPLEEIKYVMYAILKIYKPEDIGIAFMYGNDNKELIEETFKNWKNIILIHKNFDNINRQIYSALLIQPEFYDNFKNWSHVLIYQTDALIMRKIDDIYFNYDYIGAPWIESNQWCKYPAGNGGFSLRNVKASIRSCEKYRGLEFSKIPTGNEDGHFCRQDDFIYPPINSEFHKAFSVEKVKYNYPVGCHQIYHCHSYTGEEWKNFLKYMEETLLEEKIKKLDTNKLLENAMIEIKQKEERLKLIKKLDLPIVSEFLNQEQKIGSFTVNLTNKEKNRWIVSCDFDYEILFCKNNNPESVVKTHKINRGIESFIHKKESGCFYLNKDNNIYLIFYPGFPNGGEPWADINAASHFNHCHDLPKDGAIILKASLKSEFVKPLNINNYYISHIKENILAFDLFSGVGYYNQLFSLELAFYMAAISKRYLILNIRHPLAACGRAKREYGLLTEFIDNKCKECLVGFEVRDYKNFVEPLEKELTLPSKISSCIIVDEEINIEKNKKDINDFANGRTILKSNVLKNLFHNNEKIIYFKQSNASRIFTNFYTNNNNNINLMNKIAFNLSKYNEFLTNICNSIKPLLDDKFISIHLRLGDGAFILDQNGKNEHGEHKQIINNIYNWLENHNIENLPVYLMTDKIDNPELDKLKMWRIVLVNEFISKEIKLELQKKYQDPSVAEFLIEKFIIEQSNIFIGSKGSTVSAHIHYNNYINKKPYYHITTAKEENFDTYNLKYNEINNSKFSWKRINYTGGHPTSWGLFFKENVQTIEEIKKIEPDEKIKKENNENVKLYIEEKNNNEIINNSEPFFSIDFWLLYSDVIIDSIFKNGITNYNYKNELDSVMKKEKIPIIFLKTDLLPYYIDILQSLDKLFILITSSNDDQCPPYLYYPENENEYPGLKAKSDKLLNRSNLKVWYAKNPAIKHTKLKPYPIGPKWQWKTTRFFGENKSEHLRIYNKYGLEPDKTMHNIEVKKNLLYLNFNQTTNNPLYQFHKNIRHKAKSDLLKNGFKWNESEDFENYIRTLSTYKFALAPPGRGIDSHRCWEALMVGTIPIVISSTINELYEGLPVVIVDSWDVITEEFLNKKYDEMIKTSYNFEKVYSEYWQKQLKK